MVLPGCVGLTKMTSAEPFDGFAQSPSWFPKKEILAMCEIRKAAGQGMTLMFDSRDESHAARTTGLC
jgi:hypothetical protein